MIAHSYIKSNSVHDITCRGTIKRASNYADKNATKKAVIAHSYIKSNPVHGITCRGTIKRASPRDTTATTKQTQTEMPPKYAGALF